MENIPIQYLSFAILVASTVQIVLMVISIILVIISIRLMIKFNRKRRRR